MPGPDLENDSADDSRTAAVGVRNKPNPNRVAKQSGRSERGGKSAKNRKAADRQNPQDFVPRGASFTSDSLPVEGSATSSDQDSEDDDSQSSYSEAENNQETGPPSTIMKASLNWNKAGGGTIRTSLRGIGGTAPSTPVTSTVVDGKHWRSRSLSVSEGKVPISQPRQPDEEEQNNNGDQANQANGDSVERRPSPMVISDDSDVESDDEADKKILLNLSLANPPASSATQTVNGASQIQGPPMGSTNATAAEEAGVEAATAQQARPVEDADTRSQFSAAKIAAVEVFESKYPVAPSILSDLSSEDRDLQLKYIYYNMEPEKVDLNLPIRCTDCMMEGHIADICPEKECEHCRAWNVHESRFCPSWRRCQRCRDRGHDEVDCPSLLKGLASEIPCDYCGSDQHIETECDTLWKLPRRDLSISQIFISVCCGFCTSNQHLIGDCPVRPFPMNSSSWSLKAVDPSVINNMSNSRIHHTTDPTNRDEQLTGLRIKGRATDRLDSDYDDNSEFLRSVRRNPVNKQPPRGNIRIAGIGRGRDFDDRPGRDHGSRTDSYIPQDYRREYRDRDEGRPPRQRSRSPRPRGRAPGRSARSRSPSRGRARHPLPPPQPPSSYRGGRGKRGGSATRGRRGRSSLDRDVYEPMPSAAKKAWDKYAL